ncbi:cytochrome P450 [Ramaria rubella]|nr:cytochrome P450 [Ramaria rubella]
MPRRRDPAHIKIAIYHISLLHELSMGTMLTLYLSVASLFVSIFLLRSFIHKLRGCSIAYLPGPPPGPWLVGNTPALLRPKGMGDADFAWTKKYGNAVHIKGTFGSDILFTADPKALQYILNTAGYNFPKTDDMRASIALTAGKGITWAEGLQHSRQRKIMNPAFSYTSLRIFLPLFRHTAQKTVSKLKDLVSRGGGTSTVVDIAPWLARTTLDAIGVAAFDYQFGAIDEGSDNKLSNLYNNLFAETFLARTDSEIIFQSIWGFLPQWLLALVFKAPVRPLKQWGEYMEIARNVAKQLVDRQVDSYALGKEGSKDIMSILVRANLSEDPKSKLGEDEILSQLTTLFLAGHETTASTINWALHELSLNPGFQRKVREEIGTARAQAAERGDTELTISDLDSMPYLLALMKETLRFHPILSSLTRAAGRDDIIPLATPQRTTSGEVITNIPVWEGQTIFLSIAAYNRLPSVWGDDAHKWRPERFLEGVEKVQNTGLGVIANIATFSSGSRGCIGWRFAMIEMQAILIELLENLEFSPVPGVEIIRGPTGIMTPMVKGSDAQRTELPITVSVV